MRTLNRLMLAGLLAFARSSRWRRTTTRPPASPT